MPPSRDIGSQQAFRNPILSGRNPKTKNPKRKTLNPKPKMVVVVVVLLVVVWSMMRLMFILFVMGSIFQFSCWCSLR